MQEQAEEKGEVGFGKRLGKIEISANHLLAVISDILDLAKIEAGRLDITLHTVAIRALIEEVTVTATPLMQANNNQFVVDVASNVTTVFADTGRLRQTLLNLLSNAAKFTDHGQVTLRVTTKENKVYFAVQDTGIGISEKDQLLIFDAFKVKEMHLSRVLLIGILAAIVFRVLFITLGVALVAQFAWVLYIFGVFLLYTGYKMFVADEDSAFDPHESKIYKFLKKEMNIFKNNKWKFKKGKYF